LYKYRSISITKKDISCINAKKENKLLSLEREYRKESIGGYLSSAYLSDDKNICKKILDASLHINNKKT